MKACTVLIASALLLAPLSVSSGHAAGRMAVAEANINVRAGPATRYPAVGLLTTGRQMTVHGCIKGFTWCDISTPRIRGWVLAANIQAYHARRQVYVAMDAIELDIPVVTYSLRSYWDDYYRDRDFYGEIDRWSDYRWGESEYDGSSYYDWGSYDGSGW